MSKPYFGDGDAPRSAARPSFAYDDSVHVLSLVEGLATAEVGTCCVLLWRENVTEERFQFQKEAIEYITNEHPGDASILCVIEPTSKPPSQEHRQQASQLLSLLAPKIRCLAFVIEGSGFRAAMIRGVLSSIELLRQEKVYPTRYFADVAHAGSWIEAQTELPAREITKAAGYLRERLSSLYQTRASLRASGPNLRSY